MERSLINAIAYAKRKADKEMYSFYEMLEDTKFEYCLRADEFEILTEKLTKYCIKHYLYKMV